MNNRLLTDIEAFLRDTGMGEYRFGLLAARNGRLIQRMRVPGRNGRAGRVWPETEERIRKFMSDERIRRSAREAAE